MEKIKSKNLFLTGLFAIAMALVVMFGFAACNEVQLKDSDFVGTWYVESEVDTYDGNSDTTTYARFQELHNKTNRTDDEEDEYVDAETMILMFNVTEEHKLFWKQYYANDSEYTEAGTWAIEENKLTANVSQLLAGDVTVEYKDGKIVINSSRVFKEKLETHKITLAKIAE